MYGMGDTCTGQYGTPCFSVTGTADQADQLTAAGLQALQGGEYIPPPVGASLDLSPSTVAQETAGGLPLNVSVASMLNTTGSTANKVMWIGAGVVFHSAFMFIGKGKRGR